MTSPAARPIAIAPSVLPADFARLGEECVDLEKAGVDRIQFDVMDGVFVPNLTFGPDVIAACRPHVSVPFEAHLMVVGPDELIPRYIDAGCEIIIVHVEACTHLHRTLARIRELGAQPAVALNPHTPASSVAHVLDLLDLILVMTVNPGFGGQAYIATMEPKIAEVKAIIEKFGISTRPITCGSSRGALPNISRSLQTSSEPFSGTRGGRVWHKSWHVVNGKFLGADTKAPGPGLGCFQAPTPGRRPAVSRADSGSETLARKGR